MKMTMIGKKIYVTRSFIRCKEPFTIVKYRRCQKKVTGVRINLDSTMITGQKKFLPLVGKKFRIVLEEVKLEGRKW